MGSPGRASAHSSTVHVSRGEHVLDGQAVARPCGGIFGGVEPLDFDEQRIASLADCSALRFGLEVVLNSLRTGGACARRYALAHFRVPGRHRDLGLALSPQPRFGASTSSSRAMPTRVKARICGHRPGPRPRWVTAVSVTGQTGQSDDTHSPDDARAVW